MGCLWFTWCPADGESIEQQARGALGGCRVPGVPWGAAGFQGCPAPSVSPVPSGAGLVHLLPEPRAGTQTALGEKCICIVCWQNRVQTVQPRRVAEHGTVRKRRGRTEEFHPADKTKPNRAGKQNDRKARALPWRGLIGNLNGLGTVKRRARSGRPGAPLHGHGTALARGALIKILPPGRSLRWNHVEVLTGLPGWSEASPAPLA